MGWRFKGKEIKYIKQVLDNDLRPKTKLSFNEKLEKLFSKKHKQKYAITANSGTSTLHIALNAFGVGHGDEVILPNLTVSMCGFAIWQCGATPVYADVDQDTFNICPNDIEKKITKKTKAIMVVHIYGLMADMTAINKIAKKYNLYVLEDCAQCFFGKNNYGQISGTVSDVGSWSFEGTKHITTGDGGIVTTNNKALAVSMRRFGSAGYRNITARNGRIRINRDLFQNPKWKRHDRLAYNYRLSEISAAMGFAQLERINFFLNKRRSMGIKFLNFLKASKTKLLKAQKTPKKFYHSYFTFACTFEGEKYGISWQKFRKKFISFGGDGIYAAWSLVSEEPPFSHAMKKGLYSGSMKLSSNYGWGITPKAKNLQKKIMQFTTNQKNNFEVTKQVNALKKTLNYFEK